MSEISSSDRKDLMEKVMYSLGAPVRELEIDNKTFDVFLSMTIEEYSSYINEWLINNQFSSLQNLNVDSADITLALTTKTLDFETSFAAAYSKQQGIGRTKFSNWELKKDFIEISSHTQIYSIPKDREVNEVLWVTPPVIGSGFDFNGAWMGGLNGWSIGGFNLGSMLPAYSTLLMSQDIKQKRKIFQSELSYKIAPGPEGTKLLFLYPIPGSSDEIANSFGRHYHGSRVYYFYYETNSKGRKKCLEENNDIIKTPNDVPINKLKWTQLNSISQVRVRLLLVAKLKGYLAINRGKFSGVLQGPNDKELKMDYEFLQAQAEREEERIYNDIKESLAKLSYVEMMEQKARIAQALNDVLKFQPSKVQYKWL